MPLPKPREGEPQDEYIARCMGDDVMQTEHQDRDERYAVCQSLWERRGEDEMPKKIYGDTEGPLGLPMRDEVASEVEGILKALPEECREMVADGPVRVAKAAQSVIDLEPRTEVSFVTLDTIDRDMEVMMPKGMDWSQWRKNPAVTLMHQYDELPVGRGLWAKKAEKNGHKGYLAKTQYIDKPADWEGNWDVDAVWHYVKEGYLPGRSIGFIPLEVRAPSEAEIKVRPELASVRRMIAKSLILEYAICTVQSNPDALLEAAGKGIVVPKLIADDMGLVVPDRVVVTLDAAPEGETEASGDAEPEPKAEEYECECIDCGHKAKSSEHCKDVPCPECGGTMRRADRPGPGQPAKEETEPEKSIGRLIAGPDDPSAAKYRTPDEVAVQTSQAALQGMGNIDVEAIVDEVHARMRGRIE